jgi:hypothetical protein
MQPPKADTTRMPRWLAIALVSLAGLLLEVGYTRIVSYKLWYYYTYLVIGLALLGIGSGGVFVAISARLRSWSTERVLAVCSVWGAVSVAAGYALIAWLPIDTVKIWDYGTVSSVYNLLNLGLIAFLLFATFIAIGIIIATLLGRAGDDVGRLYFADLVGAGVACLVAIPLISRLGPPSVIALAALIFALVGVFSVRPGLNVVFVVGIITSLVLAAGVADEGLMPTVEPEAQKISAEDSVYSAWGPVFRVDVLAFEPDPPLMLLAHDGTFGSGIRRFDGDASALTQYETDIRAVPFDVLGGAPGKELIIGSAGGQEILTSLYYGADDIDAVELNPVTVSLLDDHFADYTGHLPERPEVDLTLGDGRSYLARSDDSYDLVWYVAPDSYAANNAASSGAFVLSESYLYTSEMIEQTLEHLTDDGIMVVQFGEVAFDSRANRTSRYVVTARDALEKFGVDDPTQHILVAASVPENDGDLSTIVVKRTPFTPAEIDAFTNGLTDIPDTKAVYAPGTQFIDHEVARLAGSSPEEVDAIVAASDFEIDAIVDDGPFFWHFSSFPKVLSEMLDPIRVVNPEDAIGERVLILLLAVAILYAAIFLLLPFVVVRRQWAALPAKGVSAVYFAALGLGFMFFEITMIQRMTRLLGYPTYSLTVTLASILVTAGLGAMLSGRLAARSRSVMPILLGALAVLTLAYQTLLDPITDSLLSAPLGVRVVVTILLLAPLGLCLGMFMPFGLGAVARLSTHDSEYVAWAWAVNGFFSVIGSVLTTMLAMTFGFSLVQWFALAIYAVAVFTFTRLWRRGDRAIVAEPAIELDVSPDPASAPAPA